MNSSFGSEGLPEEQPKIFDGDFSWKTRAEIASDEAKDQFALMDKEYLNQLSQFLRNELGHEGVADYIDNLGGGSKYF